MKDLITSTVQALVEHPSEVDVKAIEGDGTVVFEVQVHPEDAGKVIGKKGRTINAIRTIIRSTAALGKKKVMMELV
ncbi:MAG: KH domain-containing protein [Candidatus Riflebacteria bacterium]|nr:KH domain-containing protein [Candidatus Riflebacteria bacterium]